MKPAYVVFLGDTHVGSNAGLCKPGFVMGGEDKTKQWKYSPSPNQEKLYNAFVAMRTVVKERSKGHRLYLMLGGDMVDGVNHHGTTETRGTTADQRDMALELLTPWASLADEVWGVTGTAAHVGGEGEDDRSIYSMLCGRNYAAKFNLLIDGKRLWWAHHGVKVGKRSWTAENEMTALAKDIYFRCMEDNRPKPDVVVGHDRHRSPEPIRVKGIAVAVCPCWQMPTYYGETFSPFTGTDIGILTWIPSKGIPEYVKADIHDS